MFGGGFGTAPSAYGDVWVWDTVGTSGWKCVSPPSTCNAP